MSDGTTWELPGVTHWDGCGNSKRPEHSGCKIQPGVPLETTLWDEGYSVGVQDSMLRATQYERILTDLITELREVLDMHPLAPSLTASVRACMDATEARLNELNGDGR